MSEGLKKGKNMDFEKNLKQLEKMSEEIASGKLGLKESIESFKKGLKLINDCKKELTQAEKSVQKLLSVDDETGEIKTEEFTPSSE